VKWTVSEVAGVAEPGFVDIATFEGRFEAKNNLVVAGPKYKEVNPSLLGKSKAQIQMQINRW
jgi:hypothetical protein